MEKGRGGSLLLTSFIENEQYWASSSGETLHYVPSEN